MSGKNSFGDLSEELLRITEDEEVVWRAKPDKQAFWTVKIVLYIVWIGILSTFIGGFVGDFWVLIDIFLPGSASGSLSGIILIGVVLAIILSIVLTWLEYNHSEYAATESRLIQFGGIIGRDYSTVNWDDVQDFETSVGIIDKIFGTGTIAARPAGTSSRRPGTTGGQGVAFKYVKHPYDAGDQLREYR